MLSEYLMTMIMLPLLALMTFVGFYILIPYELRRRNNKIPTRRLLIGFLPFLVSASFVYILVQSQSSIGDRFGIRITADYTPYILNIEGDIVAYFQSFTAPVITYVTGFVYLIIFSFFLIFTFVILLSTRNIPALEEFTIAFIIIYLAAFPFYIFIPVTVTGHTLPNVEPLLYDLSPIIDQGVRVVDPYLDNDFPSLHAALSIMALLIVLFRTDLKRYKIFGLISTPAILFSTLYLGIHWITDLIGGAALALISYAIAIRYRKIILQFPHRILAAIEKKAGIMDSILCSNCSKQILIIPHCQSVNCPHCGFTLEYHPLTYG